MKIENNAQYTIIVIDDSPSILTYLTESLRHCGYTVHPFKEPLSALEALHNITPDLILSDVNMPNMDGYEFCEKVKEQSHLHSIPFLFLSGEKKPKNIVHGFEVGAIDYVTKPVILEVLCARIETHIKLFNLQKKVLLRSNQLEELVAAKVKQVTLSQMGTITALANLAEHRDEDTGSHLDRVQAYCEVLALELSQQDEFRNTITANYIDLLKDSSALHDIGKVAIPDQILLKPGKLTFEEFEVMKQHSRLGADTLLQVLETDPTNDFMKIGYEIALNHHEKWDGSGYPNNISGNNIPLSARIMAVADVYDALRSERCYKKGFPHSKAYAIIEEGSGNHFDPQIVKCFLAREKEFDAIWNRFAEVEVKVPSKPSLDKASP